MIIMEERNINKIEEMLIKIEEIRRIDVLKIDEEESGLKRGKKIENKVDIMRIDLNVEKIDIGKFIEKK